MKEETRNALQAVCNEIEELMRGAAPVADPHRVQRIDFLCGKLLGQSPTLGVKANLVARLAGIYFSARKHENARGGAAAVMQDMQRALSSAREEIAHLWRSTS